MRIMTLRKQRSIRPLPRPPHRRNPPQPNPRRKPCSTSSSAFLRRQSLPLFSRAGRKKGGINQQEAAETKPLPPEVPDEPTQQVEEASKARVALACIGGALQGMTFPDFLARRHRRDPKHCSIIYPKDAHGISSVHCAAEPTADGQIILIDLGSTYGTMAGGQQLTAGKGVTLHPGDAFTLGGKRMCSRCAACNPHQKGALP